MKLAILSDIHANIEALAAVLDDARHAAPGARLVCLGDMVGYGADPEAAVQAMMAAGAACVKGNHEAGVVDPSRKRRFNPQAWEALRWAASRLSRASVEWLMPLPASLRIGGCHFVHGMPPADVDAYLTQTTPGRLRRIMEEADWEVCFVGHTHRLRLASLMGGEIRDLRLEAGTRALEPGARHLVNAGAVGQPRDGDRRAKYLIFDPEGRELTVRFVDYDFEAAAGKIIASGQPQTFAERLLLC
jgi:predicted phosphodiesterase